MYDVDGNGVIDLEEMTKIVQAIYDMLGAGAVKPTDTAEERAKNIFTRWVIAGMSCEAENSDDPKLAAQHIYSLFLKFESKDKCVDYRDTYFLISIRQSKQKFNISCENTQVFSVLVEMDFLLATPGS